MVCGYGTHPREDEARGEDRSFSSLLGLLAGRGSKDGGHSCRFITMVLGAGCYSWVFGEETSTHPPPSVDAADAALHGATQ